jgi:hypothetical protein
VRVARKRVASSGGCAVTRLRPDSTGLTPPALLWVNASDPSLGALEPQLEWLANSDQHVDPNTWSQAQLQMAVRRLANVSRHLESVISQMDSSRSWRLFRPLRSAAELARRVRARNEAAGWAVNPPTLCSWGGASGIAGDAGPAWAKTGSSDSDTSSRTQQWESTQRALSHCT